MELCVVRHKVKKIMANHVEKHLGNSDTEVLEQIRSACVLMFVHYA